MDFSLHSLNGIKTLEVIDISSGSKVGYIADYVIDCINHKVKYLIIPIGKQGWFSRNDFIEIEWGKIVKIGSDVVLVDLKNGALKRTDA